MSGGKLGASGFEQTCRVRDISPRGIGIVSRWLPQAGQRVSIGMSGLDPSPAVVIWRGNGRCGLAFLTEQDPGEVVSPPRDEPLSRLCRRG